MLEERAQLCRRSRRRETGQENSAHLFSRDFDSSRPGIGRAQQGDGARADQSRQDSCKTNPPVR